MNQSRTALALIVVSCLLAGFAAGRLSARRHSPGRDGYSRMIESFGAELGLTPGQKGRIAAVLQAKREKSRALRAELRKTTREEIQAVLTPEQKARFEAFESKWREEHPPRDHKPEDSKR